VHAVTSFGPWSTTLAIGAGFGLAVALLLAFTRSNIVANRLLALLLLVFVLKLMPYVLGFAGYYDAYPWLSFAPFNIGLAIGPLLYLHVCRLTSSALPRGWSWHLLPGALQFAYRMVMFMQPMEVKDAWNDRIHRDWIDPMETLLELLSFAIYLWRLSRLPALAGRAPEQPRGIPHRLAAQRACRLRDGMAGMGAVRNPELHHRLQLLPAFPAVRVLHPAGVLSRAGGLAAFRHRLSAGIDADGAYGTTAP
jgi:hypothetical protein